MGASVKPSAGGGSSGLHKMDVLGGGTGGTVDLELIEELIAGTTTGVSDEGQQMHGLQQFRVESTSKVVHIKAASLRKAVEGSGGGGGGASAVVVAGGAGWGMPLGDGGGQATVGPLPLPVVAPESKAEAQQLQAELAKKRQLRNVRKAFGLQPTPLSDTSAQVQEVGAGAWQ